MEELESFLHAIGQEHLLKGVEGLSPLEYESFKNQILRFNETFFYKQRAMIGSKKGFVGEYELAQVDLELSMGNRRLGIVILAGGDGTRLGFNGPKGCFEIKEGQSLFRILIEKSPKECPIAVITSPRWKEQVEKHFVAHEWFNRSQGDLVILTQNMWPMMDKEGNWFKGADGQLAVAPNGNGDAIKELYLSETALEWKHRGIEYVSVMPIDNHLASPHLIPMQGDLVVKAIRKKDLKEKIGVFATKGQRLYVLEYIYSDWPGFEWGNSGLFACRLDWLMQVSENELPWHLVEKLGVYRFETHIYDFFPLAQEYHLFPIDRNQEFAPLKEKRK